MTPKIWAASKQASEQANLVLSISAQSWPCTGTNISVQNLSVNFDGTTSYSTCFSRAAWAYVILIYQPAKHSNTNH